MPSLDVKRFDLLHQQSANVGLDLVGQQFSVTLGCLGGDIASGLPLLDAGAHMCTDGHLAGVV
jgi:hypothetical protein